MTSPSTTTDADGAGSKRPGGLRLRSTYVRVAIFAVLVVVARVAVASGTNPFQSTATPAPATSDALLRVKLPGKLVAKNFDAATQTGQDSVFADVTASAGTTFAHHADRVAAAEIPREQLAGLLGTDHPSAAQVKQWARQQSPVLVEHGTLRYYSTGQAWGDVDGDGFPDLYLTDQVGPNELFHNNGDGTFSRSPYSAQVALPGRVSGGAVFADYDNDGWPDLLVLGNGASTLFHNDRGRGFTDVTERSGLIDPGQGETATWGDFDGDGNLDVYIVNYGCQPCNEAPGTPNPRRDQDRLYRNRGDGTFQDLTAVLRHFPATRGLGFSAGWFDYDGDGRPDLYLVNDVRDDHSDGDLASGAATGKGTRPGNLLLHNDGPGCGGWCFTDVTEASHTAIRADAMGLTIADADGNGTPDLFFTNGGWRAGPTKLFTNNGDGTFTDASERLGTNLGTWSWGCNFLDVDNDGRADIYVSVGLSELAMEAPLNALPADPATADPVAIRAGIRDGSIPAQDRGDDPPWPVAPTTAPRTDNDRLLHQRADGTFEELVLGPTDAFSGATFGSAVADFDGDGWPDVVTGNMDSGYHLLRNRASVGSGNHRVALRFRGDGRRVNRDAVGTRVQVHTTDGRTLTRWVRIGGSLGSGDDTTVLVGTGPARVASFDVRWPDGTTASFPRDVTDQRVVVSYGDATPGTAPLR